MFGRIGLSDQCVHVSERSIPEEDSILPTLYGPIFLVLWSVTNVNFYFTCFVSITCPISYSLITSFFSMCTRRLLFRNLLYKNGLVEIWNKMYIIEKWKRKQVVNKCRLTNILSKDISFIFLFLFNIYFLKIITVQIRIRAFHAK